MGNIAGALHSLLPKIYLQATPQGGRAWPEACVDPNLIQPVETIRI
jgi:hypothetical protein